MGGTREAQGSRRQGVSIGLLIRALLAIGAKLSEVGHAIADGVFELIRPTGG